MLKHTVSNSLTHGAFIPCFMCRCSSNGDRAQCSRFQEKWSLKTRNKPSILRWRRFFGGGGVRRHGGGNESFWSYGRGIQWRMLSGSPRHSSVTKTHFKRTCVLDGFPKNSSPVSEDRNFSLGGRSCGNHVVRTWGCHGNWLGIGQHWYQ